MANLKISGILLRDMIMSGAALLTQNREQVDALNVFPVPDGDTGTNMSQTINAAVKELGSKSLSAVGDIADAAARGALKGARGNSGVILSQILRGYARALAGEEEIDAALLLKMLRSGADTAYKAVMKPKEGTILTVARVIAEDLENKGRDVEDVVELFRMVISSGEAILKRTPEMLPVLKQAGVVDSGGMGLLIVLKGMFAALSGEPCEAAPQSTSVAVPTNDEYLDDIESLDDITFAYCTEFIVSHPRENMREDEVTRLRRRLERIGDCVLVISDMSVVKVHVHTNEPGKALQYALELGELDAIKIDNMREEFRERLEKRAEAEAARKAEPKEYGVVSVALGDGFAQIFHDLGVDKVVDGGQTMNPSIEDIRAAVEDCNAKNVFVLPNNTNIILAAQQAAELTECNLVVLQTKSVPMGISALLAFNPEVSVEENTEAMAEAAQNVHTASVTFAVRDTTYDNREIKNGDIMGLIDNKLEVLGHDIQQVAKDLVEKMIDEDTSLITIYYGSDVNEEQAQVLCDELADHFDSCDVECQAGGQPLYYYLISVE